MFRPNLEILDALIMPTVNNWIGGVSHDAANAANWSLGHVPLAGEDVLFVPYVVPLSPPTSVDCDNFHGPSGGGDFNSIYVDDDYGAKVTASQGFSTKALHLRGGTIDQPISGTDITVTGDPTVDSYNQDYLYNAPDFKWTGGTLNSTSHLANLNIDNASATIAPANAGTLHNGDQLNFSNGATGLFLPGEEYFDNGAGIDVGEDCAVVVKPTADAVVTHNSNVSFDAGEIHIAAGGYYTVTGTNNFLGPAATYDAKIPLVNDGGTVTVQHGATLSVLGRHGGNLPEDIPFLQQGGLTQIENGSILKARSRDRDIPNGVVESTVVIKDGTFSTVHHSGLLDSQQKAWVDGGFWLDGTGADLIIGYGGTVRKVFDVMGSVSWNAGAYHPLVNSSDMNKSSLWLSDHDFSVANGVTIVPELIGTPTSGNSWKIIQSANAIAGQMPTVSGWTLLAPNPATEWDLKKN